MRRCLPRCPASADGRVWMKVSTAMPTNIAAHFATIGKSLKRIGYESEATINAVLTHFALGLMTPCRCQSRIDRPNRGWAVIQRCSRSEPFE